LPRITQNDNQEYHGNNKSFCFYSGIPNFAPVYSVAKLAANARVMNMTPSPIRHAVVIWAAAVAAGCSGGHAGSMRAPTVGFSTDARQVANRLTFGPREGDVANIDKLGVGKWFDAQLRPEKIEDRALDAVLARFETQHKEPFELIADHPLPQELQPRLGVRMVGGREVTPTAQDSIRYRQAQQTANALTQEILSAKILRAAFSERQVLEIMTDFWENHFSVNIGKSPSRFSLVEYDRLIRAHALGRFRDLLGAVAKSPQMLFYLDNWQSLVDSAHPTMAEARIQQRRNATGDSSLPQVVNRRRSGINENYARELLELHTLGVNGGYTQSDVIEVARSFTGWTIDNPQLGGSFFFRADQHDAGEKVVLGTRIPGGRGIEDGDAVLDLLAKHPSTARYIATKLIVRLVRDTAPPALVARAAETFLRTDGDIREVLRTIVFSPEFFDATAYRAKVKTPFEFVVSALRLFGAEPDTLPRIAGAISRLGQPVWGRVTPDGWPDRGEAWINSGAMMNRVTFATQASQGGAIGATLSRAPGAMRLVSLGPDEQAAVVINTMLQGNASTETRDAIRAEAASTRPPAQRLSGLIAVVLSSPEFQRR
jgi:uncharacterized protein (DUF1800 family)